jgi:hypothetical protein
MAISTGFIILSVVGVILVVAIAFGIKILMNRNKIKIILENYNFKPGDKIKGKILVKSNYTQMNSLNVGISCYLVQRSYNGRNGSSSKRRKLFDFEKPLKTGGGLTKGTEIPFELDIPKDVMVKIENSVAKAAMGVLSALSGQRRRYDWYVETRIDKGGLDVRNWQKIVVN